MPQDLRMLIVITVAIVSVKVFSLLRSAIPKFQSDKLYMDEIFNNAHPKDIEEEFQIGRLGTFAKFAHLRYINSLFAEMLQRAEADKCSELVKLLTSMKEAARQSAIFLRSVTRSE